MRSPPSVATGLFAGRYAIEREIGQGASAIVYLARDTQAGTAIALKILRPELVESRASDRFLREIKRTSGLQHPSILPVLDAGEHEGQLYCALPYMEGGTLRDVLRREKRLEFPRILEIARTIAEALDYAHQRGLIHRDVKPENILFTGGQACLGDFGIARAIDLSGSGATGTTSRNVVRGTPAYMSPEQAAGSQELDGRSDVFSLACVIYEMITGMQAYIGPTDEAVIAMRFIHPPRDLRVYRSTAPPALDEAVQKAFAVTPADRYRTAVGMVHALAAAVAEAPALLADRRRHVRPITVAAGVSIATVVLAGALLSLFTRDGRASPQLDPRRFAVFPAEGDTSSSTDDVIPLLREAMLQWRGITVADAFHVQDVLSRGAGARDLGDLTQAAERLGAGRFVSVESRAINDSLTITATLFETATGGRVAEGRAAVDTALVGGLDAMTTITEALLFPVGQVPSTPERIRGTQSHPAQVAYLRGHDTLEEWDLAAADSAFQAATLHDPVYAQAHLWLAQVRSWKREPPARWAYAAERAAANAARLGTRDSILALALVQIAGPQRDIACQTLAYATEMAPYDFAAWYGLGNCLAFDSAVVRDPRSSSGWRFRSSYHRALEAYDRAFRLLPSIHRSFRGGWFADIQRLLKTQPSMLRKGAALSPDTGLFSAYPSWSRDTLEFVPYRTSSFDALESVRSDRVNVAVIEQRKRFHALTTMWRAAYPQSVDALHAVAASLDQLGDPSALDTIRLARSLARSGSDRLRVGTMEVWMRVKRSVTADTTGLIAAAALADSLLQEQPADIAEARLLASLAALRGKGHLAAKLAVAADRASSPPAIGGLAPRYLAYAALGGPAESLLVLEQRITSAMTANMTSTEQDRTRYIVLLRGALLRAPARSNATAAIGTAVPERMLHALRSRDPEEARKIIGELAVVRRRAGIRAYDQTVDAIYAEGAMLVAVGDSVSALTWMSPVLDSLALAAPQSLADYARAGTLVRLIALRSELERAVGQDSIALLWRNAARILWRDADAFVLRGLSFQ